VLPKRKKKNSFLSEREEQIMCICRERTIACIGTRRCVVRGPRVGEFINSQRVGGHMLL
jgi:hypothetical protein